MPAAESINLRHPGYPTRSSSRDQQTCILLPHIARLMVAAGNPAHRSSKRGPCHQILSRTTRPARQFSADVVPSCAHRPVLNGSIVSRCASSDACEEFLYYLKGGGCAAAGHAGTATPAGCDARGRRRRGGPCGRGLRPRPRPARDSPSGRPPHPPATPRSPALCRREDPSRVSRVRGPRCYTLRPGERRPLPELQFLPSTPMTIMLIWQVFTGPGFPRKGVDRGFLAWDRA
jgi:hypothetical protein